MGAVAGLVLVVVGWSARGNVHVTSRNTRAGRPASATGEDLGEGLSARESPSPRWAHVLGDERLSWAWVLLLAVAVAALDRDRGGHLPVGLITAGAVAVALVSAGVGALWTAWRRGQRAPAVGRSVATVLVLAAAVVLGAWFLGVWVEIGASGD